MQRRHVERPVGDPESQPLIQSLKRALYGDHPLDLLALVSSILAATEPKVTLGPPEPPAIDAAALIETFIGTDVAPTTAALHVIAAFLDDEALEAAIREELVGRTQPMPTWVRDLPRTTIARVWESREELRDGEDYFLDIRLPDGYEMTGIVYVDNNLGEVVKDGFVVPVPIDVVAQEFTAEPGLSVEPVDPAWARARMDHALELSDRTFPPLTSETWPAARALVRWLLRMLPEGGELDESEEWSERQRAELVERFLASSYGRDFRGRDHRGLVEDLVWFGTSQGVGDPLRWSPVNVEIVLADWFPRKVVADVAYLEQLPAVLRAFIRYSHRERSIATVRSTETLLAVDRWEPTYQAAIRTDRPQGAEALARALLEAGGTLLYDDTYLEDAVGGAKALGELDAVPLPDEPFDWTEIPDDIAAKVGAMVQMLDSSADDLLDVEHRTANRRLLRDVVLADPGYFRGRAAARTSAAAIVWMVAHANDSISPYALTTQELLEPFGVGSAAERARRFRSALGLGPLDPYAGPMALGSPRYLVSERRRELIAERDLG